jgi:hypothetical protein
MIKKIDKRKLAKDKIEDLFRQIEAKNQELLILRTERDRAMDPLYKVKINKNISLIEEEIDKLINTVEKLNAGDFPKLLFDYLVEFDFGNQRKEYVEYLQKANNEKIGAFVIHSEGSYNQIAEHFWFWQCVLPSYLNNPHAIKQFYKPRTSDLRTLFVDFKASIKGDFDYDEPNETEIGQDEVEKLIPVFREMLSSKDVIIYIHLSTDFLGYNLIYEFLEQIWKPICDFLTGDNDRENWLKLFVIDNEVSDLDGKDYHVDSIEESIHSRKPYKLERCGINSKDFYSWVINGKTQPEKVFFKFLHDCDSFLNCLNLRKTDPNTFLNAKQSKNC